MNTPDESDATRNLGAALSVAGALMVVPLATTGQLVGQGGAFIAGAVVLVGAALAWSGAYAARVVSSDAPTQTERVEPHLGLDLDGAFVAPLMAAALAMVVWLAESITVMWLPDGPAARFGGAGLAAALVLIVPMLRALRVPLSLLAVVLGGASLVALLVLQGELPTQPTPWTPVPGADVAALLSGGLTLVAAALVAAVSDGKRGGTPGRTAGAIVGGCVALCWVGVAAGVRWPAGPMPWAAAGPVLQVLATLTLGVGALRAGWALPPLARRLAEDGLLPSAARSEAAVIPALAIAAAAAGLLLDLPALSSVTGAAGLMAALALHAVAGLAGMTGDFALGVGDVRRWGVQLAAACVAGVALVLGWPWLGPAVVAVGVGLLVILARRSLRGSWGDVHAGMLVSVVRAALLAMREGRVTPEAWRPHVMVPTEDISRSLPVVALAADLTQRRGLVSVLHLLDVEEDDRGDALSVEDEDNGVLALAGLDALVRAVLVRDREQGLLVGAQAGYAGALSVNCVALGFVREAEGAAALAAHFRLVRQLDALGLSALIFAPVEGRQAEPASGEMVVWWAGRENNGDLMLMLAKRMCEVGPWINVRPRLCTVVKTVEQQVEAQRELDAVASKIGWKKRPEVLLLDEGEAVVDVIVAQSARADLVWMGMGVHAEGEEAGQAEATVRTVTRLPAVVLVRNSGPFRGRLV